MKDGSNSASPYPVWIFIMLAMLLGLAHEALSDDRGDDVAYLLQQKVDSIQIMTQKIDRQRLQADQLRQRLALERQTVADEINFELRRIGAKTFKLALHSPRIAYNLKLVGWLDGYLKALDGRIAFYESGAQRLDYLHAKALDDLKLIQTFTISGLDSLMTDIDAALDAYHLAAIAPLFDVHTIATPDAEAAYKDVVQKK